MLLDLETLSILTVRTLLIILAFVNATSIFVRPVDPERPVMDHDTSGAQESNLSRWLRTVVEGAYARSGARGQ